MTDRKKTHPLSVLHILAMVAVLFWWSWYFWDHSPARELLSQHDPPVRLHHASASLQGRPDATLAAATSRAGEAVKVALVDISGGLVVLFLFGFATGVYVRRFEIWLQARSSGAAMSLAGAGLSDKALAANANRGETPR